MKFSLPLAVLFPISVWAGGFSVDGIKITPRQALRLCLLMEADDASAVARDVFLSVKRWWSLYTGFFNSESVVEKY